MQYKYTKTAKFGRLKRFQNLCPATRDFYNKINNRKNYMEWIDEVLYATPSYETAFSLLTPTWIEVYLAKKW